MLRLNNFLLYHPTDSQVEFLEQEARAKGLTKIFSLSAILIEEAENLRKEKNYA